MALKPTKIEKPTDEDMLALKASRGVGFKWPFPEKVFDGDVWKLTVPNDQVSSATNSFRNQCQSLYGQRAEVRRANGHVFVRMLPEKYKPKTRTKK